MHFFFFFFLPSIALLTILTFSDIYFVHDAYVTTLEKGPSVQLVFGFEYALLITLALNAGVKYLLHSADVHSDTFWESKAVLLLYLEFFIGKIFIKLKKNYSLNIKREHVMSVQDCAKPQCTSHSL